MAYAWKQVGIEKTASLFRATQKRQLPFFHFIFLTQTFSAFVIFPMLFFFLTSPPYFPFCLLRFGPSFLSFSSVLQLFLDVPPVLLLSSRNFVFQDLQNEIDKLQEKMAELNDLKYKLHIANPNADTTAVDKAVDDLNQRLLGASHQLSDRQSKLEQALMQCGQFRDAMQSLLEWLADTRDEMDSQDPVAAADPKVLKAQLQEQKVGGILRYCLRSL